MKDLNTAYTTNEFPRFRRRRPSQKKKDRGGLQEENRGNWRKNIKMLSAPEVVADVVAEADAVLSGENDVESRC